MKRRIAAAALAFALALGAATLRPAETPGVRVEDAVAPDPGDQPLDLRIWYPANPQGGTSLPLVVISHGTGGGKTSHTDTAVALARAGYVVAAMSHTGDNYSDTSAVGRGTHLDQRPRHVSHTIDYMLGRWSHRRLIDPARIGMFGHSAGGFTALVMAGAEPDLSRGATFCRKQPAAWTCGYLRKQGYRLEDLGRRRHLTWAHDARVKVAVIAAPAIGYSFDRAALANVRIPFQLWAAEHDAIVDDSPTTIRQALPVAPEFHGVGGAGHFSFLEPCGLALRALIAVRHWLGTEAICTDPDGFDRVRFHEEFNRAVASYFDSALSAKPMTLAR